MREKFLIRLENEAIGMRYVLKTGAFMIGGLMRLREDIEAIMQEYFDIEPPLPTYPQNRKVRYDCKLGKRAFDSGLKRLRDNGLIEKVDNLGRIVR